MNPEHRLNAQLRAILVSLRQRTDSALRITLLISDPARQTTISILKGWGFVIFTALLLYWLIHRHTAELRESEERYRMLVEQASDGIFITDLGGKYIEVNNRGCAMLGYTRAEILNKRPIDFLPPEDARALPAQFDELEAGKTVISEHRLICKDGSLLPVEVSTRLLPDGYLQGIVRDVTERKQTEEMVARQAAELRQRNEELVRLYRASGKLISGSTLTLDELTQKVIEVVQGEFGQSNCSVFLQAPDSNTITRLAVAGPYTEAVRKKTFTTGSSGLVPHVLRTGQLINAADVHAIPHYASNWADAQSELTIPLLLDGQTLGAIDIQSAEPAAFNADDERLMTVFAERAALAIAQKQAETQREAALEAARYAEQRYRQLFNEAPAMYVITANETGEAVVTDCNELFLSTLGYDHPEVVQQPLAKFYTPNSLTRMNEGGYQRALAGSFMTEERDLRARDGRVINTLLRAMPEIDAQGQVQGTRAMYIDITERKQAEAALRESEQRYRLLFENNPHPMWVYDLETLQFLAVNEAAIQHYGYTRDEFLVMTIKDIRPSEDVPALLDDVAQTVSPLNRAGVWRHRTQDGTLINVEITSHITDFAGRAARLVLATDVTERLQAEEALQTERHRLRTLIDNLPDVIFLKDRQSRFIVANRATAVFMGMASPEELIGHTDFDFYPQELAAQYYATEQQIIQSGKTLIGWERQQADLQGNRHWLSATKLPLRNAQGQIVGLVGIERVITARKEAEAQREAALEELAYERNLLRTLIDHIPDYIYVKDTESRFLMANKAVVRHMGADSADGLIGKTDWDFYPPERAAQFQADEQAIIESGQALIDHDEPNSDAAGNLKWIVTTKLPMRDSHGQIVGLVGVGHDLTERKRAEEEVMQLNQELEQRVLDRTAQLEAANKELESFSYSVSHDLRAPLRAIDGFSRILLREAAAELSAENQRYLDLIRDNVRQMNNLIDALLTFSRLGRKPLDKQSVDMNQMARQTVESLRPGLEERQLEVLQHVLCPCQGDPELLKQVWTNLLSNAFKYTRTVDLAVVEIGCQKQAAECVYYVKDNGVGFDMQYAHKLFGVFQRLHGIEEYEGTGVGLALVQRIVARHGGRVWTQAAVGQGATFFFTVKN